MILPIVHRNGTSRETLVEQRCEVGRALREVLHALAEMTPNGRDYYPVQGLLQQAEEQHRTRVETVKQLYEEINIEAEAICDGEGTR